MTELFHKDRVVVVTGAASGIGRSAALTLAAQGMRIAMVDVDADRLASAAGEVEGKAGGADRVLAKAFDVADAKAMSNFAQEVLDRFEAPALLMNNAAMFVHGGEGDVLAPLDLWHRVFAVNFFGVLNGVAAFAPAMLASGARAMIVNTGSKQGLTHPPGNPSYNTVKAAVNAYTQNLARDLRERPGSKVSAHLLVPGWTTTGDSTHRPGAWLPEQVVAHMLAALAREDFYIICPDDETTPEMDRKRILWQAFDMVENRPALSRWHPDYKDAFAAYMQRDLDRG